MERKLVCSPQHSGRSEHLMHTSRPTPETLPRSHNKTGPAEYRVLTKDSDLTGRAQSLHRIWNNPKTYF